ncbi:hypothetical protein T08_16053 [Trichinella sp. T8]|nr:hypothetical protein T08_16053 [Trichinella sp. T8]
MYLVFAVACCYSRTWLSARISMHLSKLCTYRKLGIMQIGNVDLNYGYKRLLAVFVAPALLAALQFSPGLSDLCCFCENMTELSSDMRLLPCE